MSEQDRKISELYQKVDIDGPDRHVDTAILTAAKREVEIEPKVVSPSSHRWVVPTSIAAGLALTIAIMVVTQPPIQPDDVEKAMTGNNYASSPSIAPEQWLQQIVILVRKDKISEATIEYQAFRKAFPDMEIDYERFAEIRQLDKTEK